jgi:hypothetical protein
MRLRDFFSVLGYVIGFVASVLGIYAYFIDRPFQEISYASAARYLLAANEWGVVGSKNGGTLEPNLYEAIIFAKNTGNQTLSPENLRLDRGLSLSLGGDVIDYKVVSKGAGLVNPSYFKDGGFLSVKFEKFDPGAELALSVFYRADGSVLGDPALNAFGPNGVNIAKRNLLEDGYAEKAVKLGLMSFLFLYVARALYKQSNEFAGGHTISLRFSAALMAALISFMLTLSLVYTSGFGDAIASRVAFAMNLRASSETHEAVRSFRANQIALPF